MNETFPRQVRKAGTAQKSCNTRILRSLTTLFGFFVLFLVPQLLLAQDLYWVGGTGNWNDARNWASHSGGPGGAGVPTSSDDVAFDEHSFSADARSIFLSGEVHCRDIDFRDISWENISLKGDNSTSFFVHGDLHFGRLANCQLNDAGELVFASGSRKTVLNTSGILIDGDVRFEGEGKWQLEAPLRVSAHKTFELAEGVLETRGHDLSAGRLIATGNKAKGLFLEDSKVFVDREWDLDRASNIDYDGKAAELVFNKNISKGKVGEKGTKDGDVTYRANCFPVSGPWSVEIVPLDTAAKNGFHLSCSDTCDGKFMAVITDGSGGSYSGTYDFTYDWGITGAFTKEDSLVTEVCNQAQIEVRVTHNGTGRFCDADIDLEVPERLKPFATSKTEPTCPGGCDGSIDYLPTGGVTPYNYSWQNGDTSSKIDSICAGDHQLRVTDDNGCELRDTVNLTDPPPINVGLTKEDVDCFGDCDGHAKVSPSGGAGAPFYFDWSTGAKTDSIGGLCGGNYSVTVYDADSCTTTLNFTIQEPAQIDVDTSGMQNLLCNGDCIGSISVSVSNGTPPYSYAWMDVGTGNPISPQQDNDTVTGLCPGDYNVQVTDANGCMETSTTVTISEPPLLTADASATNIQCFGEMNGTVSVNVNGGTPGYSYQWFDGSGNPVGGNSPNLNGLSGGDYYVQVTDANACDTLSDTVTVDEPPELTTSISGSDVTCFGECDGEVSVVINGGVTPYQIDWYHAPADTLIGDQDNTTADSLCAGDYYGIVTDANGCDDTTSLQNIAEPPQLTATTSKTDVTCFSACDGTASVTINGGTTPYSVDWMDASSGNPIGQTGTNANNLCPGDYYPTITDNNGCTLNADTVTIAQPNDLTVSLDLTHVSCGGMSDGSITANPGGGTSPYSYQWFDSGGNPLGTGQTESGLDPGDYYVEVTDDNNCTETSNTVTITEPAVLTVDRDTVNASCGGDCDGMAIAEVSGGTTPYNYIWIRSSGDTLSQSTDTASSLCADTYAITVIDDNGCQQGPDSIEVSEPPVLDPSLATTGVSCNGNCDGTASLSVNGGTPGYNYNWYGAGSGTSVSNLCGGVDSVTITDSKACDSTIVYTIDEPNTLTLSVNPTDPSCSGQCDGSATTNVSGGTTPYSYQWYDGGGNPIANDTNATVNGYCDGNYSVEVVDSSGCSNSQSFTLNAPTVVNLTVDSAHESSCGGICDGEAFITATGGTTPYSYQWYDATNGNPISFTMEDPDSLCSGDYYAEVTDDNGCNAFTDTVSVANTVTVTPYVSKSDISCNGACDGMALTDSVKGGDGPYEYYWINSATGDTVASIPDVGGLCPGTYAMRVRDTNLCSSLPEYVTISAPAELTLGTDSTALTCFNDNSGEATVTPTGGTPPYSYQWDGATGNQTDSTATGLSAGTYDVTVTDANGCSKDTSVTVTQPTELTATKGSINIACYGDSSGVAWVDASGGSVSGSYTYQWYDGGGNPIAGETSDSLIGFPNGSYSVQIQDDSACTIVRNFNLSEPSQMNASISNSQDVLCNGEVNGSATVSVNGGTPAYSYSWNDPSSQDSSTALNLPPGTWTVTVNDANSCDTSLNVTIDEPRRFFVSTDSMDVTCNGNCDGQASVTVDSGATAPFSYTWNDPLNQTNDTAKSLCAGTYDVVVADDNGCDTTVSVEVVQPAPLNITVDNAIDPACNDSCDGKIEMSVTGGVVAGDYTYAWYDANTGNPISPQQDSAVAEDLCDSRYVVEVTDDNGCMSASDTVTLTQPVAMTATFSKTFATCGNCDGTVKSNVNNGVPPYSYNWTPGGVTGQGTDSISDLCAGIYNLEVTDDLGCVETFSVPVSEQGREDIASSSASTSCNGAADGAGYVVINGGCSNPPCTVDWFDDSGSSLGVSNDTITGLAAGLYYVEVQNSAGCSAFDSVVVSEPDPIDPNVTISQHVSCNGGCDGQAQAAPTGGNGDYSHAWIEVASGDTVSKASTASNLCAGNYDLTVTDSVNCDTTVSINIQEPPVLDVTDLDSTMIDCNGNANGTATVFPAGGSGDIPSYTYRWFDCATATPIGQTTQQATNLDAGSYYVEVTDTNGCVANSPCVTITQPGVLAAPTSVVNFVSCNGSSDGSAEVSASGGTPSYAYQWYTSGGNPIAGATDDTLSGVSADTYTIEVTDANGCVTTNTVDITEPGAIDASLTASDVTCNGGSDGQISSAVSGGVSPYSYQWTDSGGNPVSTNASITEQAGTYTVVITDANGCDTTLTDSIGEPTPISTNITGNPGCYGICDGQATASVSGGNGSAYGYQWIDSTGSAIPGATNAMIDSICPGDYALEVTDTAGCTDTTAYTLGQGTPITATTSTNNATCGNCNGSASVNPSGGVGGFSYSWNTTPAQSTQMATNICSGVYTVTVTDANGCSENFNANVSDQGAEDVSTDSTNVTCSGGADGSVTANFVCGDTPCTILWTEASSGDTINTGNTTVNNLAAGDYFAHVTNASGCTAIEPVTVLDGDTIRANPDITHVTCNGDGDGEITVAPSGGTGPYGYSWTDGSGSGIGNTATVSGLTPDTYSVVITDNGTGCDTTYSYTITQPNVLAVDSFSTIPVACNGDSTGEARPYVSGGASPYTYSWNDPESQVTATADSLPQGVWDVTVTDTNGCTTTAGVNIPEPAAIDPNLTTEDLLCNGDTNGTASVAPTGGTPGYSYQWYTGGGSAIPGETDSVISDLSAGNYNVQVADTNGCVTGQLPFAINEPSVLAANMNPPVNNTCNGDCTGEVSVNAVGGTPGTVGYTYQWTDTTGAVIGGDNDTVTGLCAGQYTVTITDSSGCQVVNDTLVTQPAMITADSSTTPSNCGFGDGTASVSNVTGGHGGYTYQWLDNFMNPIGQNTAAADSLEAGDYFCRITDDSSCTRLISVTVDAINEPTITLDSLRQPSCDYTTDGGMFISVSGASGPVNYAWNPGGAITQDLTNVGGGIYTVTITDSIGCSVSRTDTIDAPSPVSAYFSTTDATCHVCDGQISLDSSSGGTPPLTYQWTTGDNTADVNNVCAGTHEVTVTDAVGCTNKVNVTLDNTGAPNVDTVMTTASCASNCSGTATVNVSGGVTPYHYSWLHNGDTTSTQDSLCSGQYFMEVEDDTGCIAVATVDIPALDQIRDSAYVQPSNCGSCDGAIVLFPGGSGNNTYQWYDPSGAPIAGTDTITGLCSGIYTVEIADTAAGCADTLTYTVPDATGPQVTASVSNHVSCADSCNGQAVANATGMNLAYEWFDASGASTGITTPTADDLCAGKYTVVVTNTGTGCEAQARVTVTEPKALEFNIPTVADASCNGTCDGVATASFIGGTAPYSIQWSGSGTSDAADSNLCAGAHTVTVTDGNGCVTTTTATVDEPAPININVDTVVDATCPNTNDGRMGITVSGGTTPYTYNWTGPDGFTSNIEDITNTYPGTYEVTVTDNEGCSNGDTIVVDTAISVVAKAFKDTALCAQNVPVTLWGTGGTGQQWYDEDGNLLGTGDSVDVSPETTSDLLMVATRSICSDTDRVTVTLYPTPPADAGELDNVFVGQEVTLGGDPTGPSGSSYNWSPEQWLGDTTIANPTLQPEDAGLYDYVVEVTSSEGCVGYDTIEVDVRPEVVFPDGFTPNGDGVNDVWNISYIDQYPEAVVEVYNRWGELLFRSEGYEEPWDGTYNGEPVPVGTYYYIIDLKDDRVEPYTGPITIIR